MLGFYHRHKGNKSKALEYYFKALGVYPDHSRTKREIVNIYLSLGKYEDALGLAKENYEKRQTNIYHIHSYFISLIKSKRKITDSVIATLNKLMDAIKFSPDIKSDDILSCMQGEYAYYIEGDFEKANEILLEAIKINQNKNYPQKSLIEIYRKEGLNSAIEELDSIIEVEEEE